MLPPGAVDKASSVPYKASGKKHVRSACGGIRAKKLPVFYRHPQKSGRPENTQLFSTLYLEGHFWHKKDDSKKKNCRFSAVFFFIDQPFCWSDPKTENRKVCYNL